MHVNPKLNPVLSDLIMKALQRIRTSATRAEGSCWTIWRSAKNRNHRLQKRRRRRRRPSFRQLRALQLKQSS